MYYPEEEGERNAKREGKAGSGRESRVVSIKLLKAQDSEACVLASKNTAPLIDDLMAHSASSPGRLRLTLTSGSQ